MPLRGRRKRYKKFTKVIPTKLTPHKASAVKTFGGVPHAEFLEEQLGMLPGEDVEAYMHLYEITSGTFTPELTQLERNTLGLGSKEAYGQLHPLTPEAAGVLLGEPRLGHEVDPRYLANPYATAVGQRFYYLEIPGKRPLMTSEPGGRGMMRRRTRVSLVLDFRGNQIRIYLYLSEIRAQEISVKLRQQAQQFIAATEEPADGVTLLITIVNPPGFAQLRQALKGKVLSLASLKLTDGTPNVNFRITPGYTHE